MNKSPAFQFYPADWIGDVNVATMTEAEEGVYIRLISFCWIHGSIPSEIEKIKRLLKNGSNHSATTLEPILRCFQTDGNGGLVHKRLEKEREKQEKWKKKSKKGGLQTQENKRNLKGGSTMVDDCLQPKSNTLFSSSSSSSSLNLKDISLNSKEDKVVASFILSEKNKLHPTHKPPDLKKWANTIRLMREQDARTHEEIKTVFAWVMRSSFWGGVCLSPDNLRKNWEQITAQKEWPGEKANAKKERAPAEQVMDGRGEWVDGVLNNYKKFKSLKETLGQYPKKEERLVHQVLYDFNIIESLPS